MNKKQLLKFEEEAARLIDLHTEYISQETDPAKKQAQKAYRDGLADLFEIYRQATNPHKLTYTEQKEQARAEAIEWQATFSTCSHSWAEIAEDCAHFEKLARRFGLVREFRENGII